MSEHITDFSRLAVHTQTNKPWSLAECLENYGTAGITAVSIWRNVIAPIGIGEAARLVKSSGLAVPALVRGGFFPAASESGRQAALDENRQIIDEAAALGAEMVVLVVGAVPGIPLADARQQVQDGIAGVLAHAESAHVRLAIEPLHPMYAGDKSCVTTMKQANDICEALQHPLLGVAVDVYHVWWDDQAQAEIARCGANDWLFGFHICDWRIPTRDLLTDRALMGDGCIDIAEIRGWVEAAGFDGYNEVEIFSEEQWASDQVDYLARIKHAYLTQS
ncbi:MAG TPA: sugar phosphate isomerase/epimerase [Lentisphaeria bacterium]|nr:sugar phosphate isomerase/epimerase [Lentisphaeria bacterium]